MSKIKNIIAREILDSRGNPTIETKIILNNGLFAKSSVPSGASTGIHEATELRDENTKRYGGLGVLEVIKNIKTKITPELIGMDVTKQEDIDNLMIKLDGTKNKSQLGANAILSISLACARAGALTEKKELYEYINTTYNLQPITRDLPTPCFNVFNGGKHADTNLDFQEFMIIPALDTSFKEKVRMGAEIFHELGKTLKQAGFDTDVGNEGGYAPDIVSSIQAIELIIASAIKAGYTPKKDFGLGIDVGSSGLYDQQTKKYIFKLDKAYFTNTTLIGLYHEWLKKYPIVYLEDGLAEDDWLGWKELTEELGQKMLVVGDDLFVTNEQRLRQGLKEKVANSIIIKLNQVGTLTETINCVKLAQKHNYKIIVSHRSGETSDDFIADLAVAIGAEYIKSGSLSRGERVAKYNRLMEIEENLNF
ncbi:MAG: phosphopyruvate hydratase [Patescibacteria group bacterium]|nr:phosphopyruvate hydratase [Patescibacteria group bacterium]MBU0879334.1 phosphopyruvate hydratase [Patescibacteria group bacterium]MBU0879935.1 phosphopyruvate hydratase [Patescibacteria group bacterium]MBU1062922.1 phosphopyruvate hydratase [Patescibacteria group bacterium]MBU1782968.1 phosphopyruvate hydratase [Patescibacteria group bacterium]